MTTKQLSIKAPVSLAVAENATTPTGADGAIIWSSSASKPLYWDGSKWAAFGTGAGGGAGLYSGTTAPVDPVTYPLWFNTSDASLAVYYNDGDTSQWVTISGSAGGTGLHINTTAPTDPLMYPLWFNTTDGSLSVYYNDGTSAQWVIVSGSLGNPGATGSTNAQATIDFGATPTNTGQFTITDAGVTTSSYVNVFMMGDSTVDNDAEAHRHGAASWKFCVVPGTGSFDLYVEGLIDLCWGTFTVRYSY